jgi:hypothetical protein
MNGLISRFVLGLGASLLVLTATAPNAAGKDARSEARSAYDAGMLAFDSGDYGVALTQFKAANELLPTPQALYWVARCLDRLEQRDEAIETYRRVLDHPDVAKLGEEKRTTAQDRLTALTAEAQSASAATAPLPPVAPPSQFAAPPQREPKFSWKNHLFELGVITGPIFLNSTHSLQDEGAQHADYTLAWLLGARVGYYPVPFVGFEIDGAHGWGRVKGTGALGAEDDSAQFNTTRGYVVGQYPIGRFVPLLLAGAGVIHATSDRLGEDLDFVLVVGAGAKVAVTKVFTPRLDWHLSMTEKRGGRFSEGFALHSELLLGVDFTLGR